MGGVALLLDRGSWVIKQVRFNNLSLGLVDALSHGVRRR